MDRRALARAVPVTAGALVVVVVAVAHWWSPFLTTKAQPIESTPSLAGLFSRSTVPVPGGGTACVKPVTFVAKASFARFTVSAPGRRAPRLRITAVAPGYRAGGEASGYPPQTDAPVQVFIPAAPRTVTGTLCVTPLGHEGIELVGTSEPRSLAYAETIVDGKPAQGGVDVAVTLLEAKRASLLGRAGEILDRASDFTGGWAPVWLLWPLLVLAVAGLPLGVVAALLVALAGEVDARPPAAGAADS